MILNLTGNLRALGQKDSCCINAVYSLCDCSFKLLASVRCFSRAYDMFKPRSYLTFASLCNYFLAVQSHFHRAGELFLKNGDWYLRHVLQVSYEALRRHRNLHLRFGRCAGLLGSILSLALNCQSAFNVADTILRSRRQFRLWPLSLFNGFLWVNGHFSLTADVTPSWQCC